MAPTKTYLVAAILLAATFFAKAQCPATLNDLLAGGTFNDGGIVGGCVYPAGGAIATLGNINFTGTLTISGVTTFTVAHNITWNGGLFDIQGTGNVIIGNGSTGSLSIVSGTVRTNDGNSGTITAQGNSSITINSGATLQSHNTISINANSTVSNSGALTNAAGGISLAGNVTNNGTITSNSATGDITISGAVTSSGQITAIDDIIITGTGNLTVSSGTMSSEDLTVNANGLMLVESGATVTTTGTDDNTISGTLTVNGTINFAGDLVIDGALSNVIMNPNSSITINRSGGDGDLEVTGGGNFTMNGGMLAVQDDITTYVGGSIASTGNLIIDGAVTVGGMVNVTGGSTLIGTGPGGSITRTGTSANAPYSFTDFNCASKYPPATYTFCGCSALSAPVMCASALPIELRNFSGHQQGTEIQLNWTTATETGNDFFTVEKLSAKDIFEEVMRVPGAGTTVVEQYYTAVDANPSIGNNYYRLKQTDYDGKTSRSELIKVTFESTSFDIQIFPNPSSGSTVTVRVHGAAPNQPTQISLQNLIGQELICAHPQTDQSGSAEIALSVTGFPAGVYLILVESRSKKLTIR